MTQEKLLIVLLIFGGIWSVIWLWIITNAPHEAPEAQVEEGTLRLRRRLIYPMSIALLVGIAFSIYFAPYPSFRSHTVGGPEVTVSVNAIQWGWILSEQSIPSNKVIQFDLTSQDVNHDFAIYDPAGELVTQAQVMPGYTNKLIFSFDKPGEYTIRCLEYCGLGHHIMVSTLTVV